jgi:hypothetical protein
MWAEPSRTAATAATEAAAFKRREDDAAPGVSGALRPEARSVEVAKGASALALDPSVCIQAVTITAAIKVEGCRNRPSFL